MHVRNMTSTRTGRPVANQYIIEDDQDREVFQSYRTVVAIKDYADGGKITLDTRALDYSVTTSRYLYAFLAERSTVFDINANERGSRVLVKRAIADGRLAVADLNPGR
jgi:hypothetical protein